MPEPISSWNPPASPGYDPTLDEDGQLCRSDAPNSSQAAPRSVPTTPLEAAPPPGVGKLVRAVPPPPSALPPSSKPSSPSTAHNNAERTSERPGIAPYASSGRVGSTNAVYAGVGLIKGHDPKSGLDAEVLSVSGQIGTQTEVQAGLVRLGRSTPDGSVAVEAMTARVNLGIYNDDGSVGLNAGAQAGALGGETTYGTVDSLTVGVSAGLGVAGSVGVRDFDKDGKHELCAKVSYGPVTLGACVETPF